jgi:flagellar hook-associated protein 2
MADLSLSGLATGMDTQGIIDQLVAIEQRPILNYQQEISEFEQTKCGWRDVNS